MKLSNMNRNEGISEWGKRMYTQTFARKWKKREKDGDGQKEKEEIGKVKENSNQIGYSINFVNFLLKFFKNLFPRKKI